MSHAIILIGYRGCGKTTLGRLIADRLEAPHLDTDRLIELSAGMSIADIFKREGATTFRRRESEAIRSASETIYISETMLAILSLGGGAVEIPENLNLLPPYRTIVWLTATPTTLRRRLEHDPETTAQRPPLEGASTIDEIESVLARRTPLYQEWSDHVVATDDRNMESIADELISLMPP
jgi:shikimate kinase